MTTLEFPKFVASLTVDGRLLGPMLVPGNFLYEKLGNDDASGMMQTWKQRARLGASVGDKDLEAHASAAVKFIDKCGVHALCYMHIHAQKIGILIDPINNEAFVL